MSTATRTRTVSAKPLRALSIVLAFTAAVGLLFGTAGFTVMEADRGLAVTVTDDERAYLGYGSLTDEARDGESTPVVEYRNRFGGDLDEFDVAVSIADPESTDAAIESVETPSSLDRGSAAPVHVTLSCPEEEPVTLLFRADGNGDGVSVSLDRTHPVMCVPKRPAVTGVQFNDAANGNVSVDGPDGDVVATVWLAENPPTDSTEQLTAVSFDGEASFDTSRKIRPQVVQHASLDGLGQNRKVVAVAFPDQDVAYVHPGWDAGVYENPSSSDGVEYDGTVDEPFLLNASVNNGEVVEDGD